jgi:hypothetical protein
MRTLSLLGGVYGAYLLMSMKGGYGRWKAECGRAKKERYKGRRVEESRNKR